MDFVIRQPYKIPRATAVMDGYGGCSIYVVETQVTLRTGLLAPRLYRVYITLVPEYILGVDVL
jgi:hypothetical protein